MLKMSEGVNRLCVIVRNIVAIGPIVAEIWRFNQFSQYGGCCAKLVGIDAIYCFNNMDVSSAQATNVVGSKRNLALGVLCGYSKFQLLSKSVKWFPRRDAHIRRFGDNKLYKSQIPLRYPRLVADLLARASSLLVIG